MRLLTLTLLFFCCTAFAGHQPLDYRNPAQAKAFRKLHACPGGVNKGSHVRCHGYVIDHILPLDCGGKDAPSNMQWQTEAQGKAKDKWERNGPTCKHRTAGAKK